MFVDLCVHVKLKDNRFGGKESFTGTDSFAKYVYTQQSSKPKNRLHWCKIKTIYFSDEKTSNIHEHM